MSDDSRSRWLSRMARFFPVINELSAMERTQLIEDVGNTELNFTEKALIVAGVGGVTYLVKTPVPVRFLDIIGMFLWQYGAAIVLLGVVVGCAHLLRVRRALDIFLEGKRRG